MNKGPGVVLLSVLCLLSGCAREISSNVYSEGHVGETSLSYQGVVISVRQVKVTNAERLQENQTGMGLGALAGGGLGGLLGSTMGKGTGNVLMTVAGAGLGAVAGGVGGAYAQQALSSQQGMEYVVKLTNGQIMTVVQGLDAPLCAGQRVFIMVSYDGRSRVVPDRSGVMDVQPFAPFPNVVKNR